MQTPSLSLPLSIYVSLWLQVTCHMMPFTKQHSACAWVVTCILFLINLTFHNLSLHSSYTIHQPFTDYFLRLPYSEQLEKRLFRSRANRRLVFLARARCLSAGLRYLRLTRLPRHDRGPVPGGNRSAASCLCTVLRRALYHYAARSPGPARVP